MTIGKHIPLHRCSIKCMLANLDSILSPKAFNYLNIYNRKIKTTRAKYEESEILFLDFRNRT